MLLTLARHGETVENVKRVVQGHWPGQLTRRGHAQSQELADRLKNQRFDAIYSSDLKRCVDTARFVRRYHVDTPFFTTSDLRELYFGSFEGKLEADVDWNPPVTDFWLHSRGGGEDNVELYERVMSCINKIYSKHPEGKVLVLTHGLPMKVVRSAITGEDLEELFPEWLDNCAVYNYKLTGFLAEKAPTGKAAANLLV